MKPAAQSHADRPATVMERLSAAISPDPGWSDSRLISSCLSGNEQAWSALIDKYKNLIFSVPLKYGAGRDDAADVFQAVCLELFSQLPRLRKAEALRSWLITVARHKTFHWMRERQHASDQDIAEWNEEELLASAAVSPDPMLELEKEQAVREALQRLPDRCREMIRLLFYEEPPLPYSDVAERLGLATGSIGFIRGRCLKRLHNNLEELGF